MIEFKEYPDTYKVRAAGWIQDASDFDNLHKFVSLFSHESFYRKEFLSKLQTIVVEEKRKEFLSIVNKEDIRIKYVDIVGTSPKGSRRTETKCNGIGQASLEGQRKDRNFQGDWPTDNFLRWAEILCFINYDYIDDTYSITSIGREFVKAIDISDRNSILEKQLSYYPPVSRILKLLKSGPTSKFEIGENLGFIGEKGFTYITEDLYVRTYASANSTDRKRLRSDFEGSSDKYARQICSWLTKLNLIDKTKKIMNFNGEEVNLPSSYKINVNGENFLRKFENSSKYILFGMLSMEASNKELHCKRRAILLKMLSQNYYSSDEIVEELLRNDIVSFSNEVEDDILSMSNMGLIFEYSNGKHKLINSIDGLEIPIKITINTEEKVFAIKELLRRDLKYVNHDLLNLVDYSLSKKSSRLFEVYVAKAFKVLNDETHLLGGPSKPDVVSVFQDLVLLIDAKAYKDGFTLPIAEQDKMIRYIGDFSKNTQNYEWIEALKLKHVNKDLGFNFTSSGFSQNINSKINKIYERSNISGSCVNVIQLLFLIDQFLRDKSCKSSDFTSNIEIIINENYENLI